MLRAAKTGKLEAITERREETNLFLVASRVGQTLF